MKEKWNLLGDILKGSLEKSAENCAKLLLFPTLKNLSTVRHEVNKSDARWKERFFQSHGLDQIIHAFELVFSRTNCSLITSLAQIECITILKCTVNSTYGMEYVTQQDDAADLLSITFESESSQVKKALFEMLAAMTVYENSQDPSQGRRRVLETLENAADQNLNQTPIAFLGKEFAHAGSDASGLAYAISTVKLINCLLLSAELQEKRQLLDELDGINFSSEVDKCRGLDNDELLTQIDLFDKMINEMDDVFIVDPELEKFQELLEKMSAEKREVIFSVLGKLARVDGDSLEKLSKQIEENEFDRLVSSPPVPPKRSAAPPPSSLPPPPPPPGPGAPPPPGLPGGPSAYLPQKPQLPFSPKRSPKVKLTPVHWDPVKRNIPLEKSIWSQLEPDTEETLQDLYATLESKFTAKQNLPASKSTLQPKPSFRAKRSLLDQKKSLNIGIFLKQFKIPAEEIISSLIETNVKIWTFERAKSALKHFEDVLSDVEIVKSFVEENGTGELGTVEKFYHVLSEYFPNPSVFTLRLELMLHLFSVHEICVTVASNYSKVIMAVDTFLRSEAFRQVLKLVMESCNFIMAGTYGGNAAAFKMNTLLKLQETRSTQRGYTLLHFIAEQMSDDHVAQLRNDSVLYREAGAVDLAFFDAQLGKIDRENNRLDGKTKSFPELRAQFETFFASSNEKIEKLQKQKENVESFKDRLKEQLPDEGEKLDLSSHFRILGDFEAQLSKARGDRRSKSVPNKRDHITPRKSLNDEPVFDNLLKEINSGKVESLSRGLDPKMLHAKNFSSSTTSGQRSRIQSRRTGSTASSSASEAGPQQSLAQKSAFANELKNVLKKNNPQLSTTPESKEKTPSPEPEGQKTDEKIDDSEAPDDEKLPQEITKPEDRQVPTPRGAPKEAPIQRNGSIPKRREYKEIATQTFQREEIKEPLQSETEPSYGCIPAWRVLFGKNKKKNKTKKKSK